MERIQNFNDKWEKVNENEWKRWKLLIKLINVFTKLKKKLKLFSKYDAN